MPDVGGIQSERLKSFIERIERLEEEKAALGADIKDVYAEAKGTGFDTKIIRQIIKLRKMDEADRQEQEALLQIYMASLGMLRDTPLGEAAINRLSRKSAPKPSEIANKPRSEVDVEAEDEGEVDEAPLPAPPPPPVTDAELEVAREAGRQAAKDGQPVTANPNPAATRLRAAWDEGWCQTQGSDGMEIPDAWRRPTKPKKADTPPPPAAAAEGTGAPA